MKTKPLGSLALLGSLTRSVVVLSLMLTLCGCKQAKQNPAVLDGELVIATAANVKDVLDEAAKEFEQSSKTKITISAGATGYLATQIESGAPFDLFISADVKTVDRLIARGKLDGQTKYIYARGKLALWSATGTGIQVQRLEDLNNPAIKKIAVAQPDLAPYGRAAIETLQSSGLFERLRDKLVYGENVGQTLQFAETGNAQVAFVSLSLTKQRAGHFIVIDEALHQPINQALGIVTSSRNRAAAGMFVGFLMEGEGRRLLEKYGYSIP